MILSIKGLFFIKIFQIKRSGNHGSYFKFEYNPEHHYFKNEIIDRAFEYLPGKFIILTDGSRNIRFFNRADESEDKNMLITNLSYDEKILSL
jgi:hypothetical protein